MCYLFFSNSKLGSTASSLPADFLKALVHLALRGFFFLLKALWHLDLKCQNSDQVKIGAGLAMNLKYESKWHSAEFESHCDQPAKVEDLAVIPDKGCPLARVAGGAAEVALLNPHPGFASTELFNAASETVKRT